MWNTIKTAIPIPCKEGIPFIIAGFFVTFILYYLDLSKLGLVMFALSVWCFYFFRDPDRITPVGEGLVVSPADGVVQTIVEAVPPPQLEMGDEPLTRVSVFLNVFNVHVNRVPVAGTITKLHYHPGKYLNASLDKASEENERQLARVTTHDGVNVGFVQIAGLVARRIVCSLKDGQDVVTGERFGLIRFGSRMDVFLPKGIAPQVVAGQIAVAGETVIAALSADTQSVRQGISH